MTRAIDELDKEVSRINDTLLSIQFNFLPKHKADIKNSVREFEDYIKNVDKRLKFSIEEITYKQRDMKDSIDDLMKLYIDLNHSSNLIARQTRAILKRQNDILKAEAKSKTKKTRASKKRK